MCLTLTNAAEPFSVDRPGHLAAPATSAAGKLTILLGNAPGVGKTYALLEAARLRQRKGVDVALLTIETHGDAAAEVLLSDLDVMARVQAGYRRAALGDIDCALAPARLGNGWCGRRGVWQMDSTPHGSPCTSRPLLAGVRGAGAAQDRGRRGAAALPPDGAWGGLPAAG